MASTSHSNLILKGTSARKFPFPLTSEKKQPQTSLFFGSLSRRSKIILSTSRSIAHSTEIEIEKIKMIQNGSDGRGVAIEAVDLTPPAVESIAESFAEWLIKKVNMGLATTRACFMSTILPSFDFDGSIMSNGSASLKPKNYFGIAYNLVAQVGILATVVEPATAVTGVNNEPDLVWVLIQLGIIAFVYFLIMPPIIMNWLRIRWYRRNLVEMYFQFMFVFLFFPGVLLWAPFLNFRKFPRDPTMKYPWSKPENPSEVKGGFLKFPWASIEDYE